MQLCMVAYCNLKCHVEFKSPLLWNEALFMNSGSV